MESTTTDKKCIVCEEKATRSKFIGTGSISYEYAFCDNHSIEDVLDESDTFGQLDV